MYVIGLSEKIGTPGDQEPYAAGQLIADKYRLVRRLGAGGMGSVWVADNLSLEVQVALKLIRTGSSSGAAEERLLTEARAMARLKHPNVVRVFDFGTTSLGDSYIVMELLAGETLGDALEREGRLEPTRAVQLLLPVADGLLAAHNKGIVHRDLKPDNIYLADSDGRLEPKVVDFGIARFALEARADRITQAGTVLGSPDYMAPEQARGEEHIDQRADVWAFCVVLYECVAGRVPFENANYNALLRHIVEDDIPSILDFGAGDPELWRILGRGFAKQREGRYPSMRELGDELAAWLVMHGVLEDVSGHSLRSGWRSATLPPSVRAAQPSHPDPPPSPLPPPPLPPTPVRTVPPTLLAILAVAALLAVLGLIATLKR
jgi:eukaryotic-like serine/threonine-protein kinase